MAPRSCSVTGGLHNPHGGHLFTGWTNGASCHPLLSPETGASVSQLLENSSPLPKRQEGNRRPQRNFRGASRIAVTSLWHSRTNGMFLGKLHLGIIPGWQLAQNNIYFRMRNTAMAVHRQEVLLPKQAGQGSRKPGCRASFQRLGSLPFAPPCKNTKSERPRQLTSQVPERVASFIHSLIHSLTPHAFIKSPQRGRRWGQRDE